MKKILLWILLLILLMILCIWSKIDTITQHTLHATLMETAHTQNHKSINYVIKQADTYYTIHGDFKNSTQEKRLAKPFEHSKKELIYYDIFMNKSLEGEEAVAITEQILPSFLKHYKKGILTYNQDKLTIEGSVDKKSHEEIQRIFQSTSIEIEDRSNIVQTEPIQYELTLTEDKNIQLKGILNNEAQLQKIKSKLPKNILVDTTFSSQNIDNGSLEIVNQFLPLFLETYTKGKITYDGKHLNVTGYVHNKEEKESADQLLSKLPYPVQNITKIDPLIQTEYVKKVKREAKAKAEALKRERLEVKKRAAEQKVKLDAKRKAQEEQKKAQAAKAHLLALEKKRLAEKVQREAERSMLKKKISTLLKLDNIEFNVNKSTLTTKGATTVDKLANILKTTTIHIEIAGHTDSDGSAVLNQKLSQERVDTVKQRLIVKGIQAHRMTAKGYGESKPLVPNTTRTNKQKNRRVEINIQGE